MVEVVNERERVAALSHHEQMLDAQAGCLPCKLCGGKTLITDAGPGYGYYIECENGSKSRRESQGCLINERRLSGWAYNVRDWWNRLHAAPAADAILATLRAGGSPQDRAIALVRRIAAKEPWQSHYGRTWEDEAAEIVAALAQGGEVENG